MKKKISFSIIYFIAAGYNTNFKVFASISWQNVYYKAIFPERKSLFVYLFIE